MMWSYSCAAVQRRATEQGLEMAGGHPSPRSRGRSALGQAMLLLWWFGGSFVRLQSAAAQALDRNDPHAPVAAPCRSFPRSQRASTTRCRSARNGSRCSSAKAFGAACLSARTTTQLHTRCGRCDECFVVAVMPHLNLTPLMRWKPAPLDDDSIASVWHQQKPSETSFWRDQ